MWKNRGIQDNKHGRYENLRIERRTKTKGQKTKKCTITSSESRIEPGGFASFLYMLCVVFIGVTSCIDALMVVKYKTTVNEEQNPLGSFLIKTTGQEGLFIVKITGTMMVVLFIIFLFRKWVRAAYLIVSIVTLFQLSLMCYIFS